MDDQAGHEPRLAGSVERRLADGAKSGLESVIGGALSLAATAVAGPLAGVGVSAAVSAVQRALTCPRGDARAVSVYQLAAAEIEDRIAAGERVRSDGFFADEDEDRSAGEEAWESVLSKCRQDPAERKLPYMAHLLAGIAFETRVDGDTAHQVIAAAEQLTYRQLCIMRLARTSNMYSLADGYRGQVNFSEDLFASLHECVDLYQRAFVRFGGEMVFDVSDVKPSEITLHGLGILLHGLMKLSDIPDEDVAKVALPMRPE